ncbi:hypothetical protein E8E15_007250 [Penicillium rubens]|uniref:Ricin B lectin domain-containing protein n=1 Tax=Penicillium chrysogenum TaxID=5076 RepID=A0A161XUF9_PENCH|nr:uncharacterized protein N7489_011845 [Penicillium chrysogenum]XP_061070608.1 uncharacterized protein N7525_006041 [Penicillium rubens]KAF3029765.1 hypothetical protein E8E15_007250 [Penicillium rubens]KAJ5043341.1 hypothetical protein NUH16_000130 [Penicillium rubens]KAJ5231137.1 hypothetical protein N7489_011845 [Penicillium chrysogenum]KAJ5253463.1 hypothetical protein N7505_012126 [Penicillium chrysogenum]KAJ5260950.1 hypothetical protein N7524_008583 [Penicillium chrysogenum]
MSDFTGPGNYKIWARHSDKVLNIWGGDEEGKRVGTWADLTNGKYGEYYQQYVIAAAGNDEYLILHQKKGLYMTATRGGNDNVHLNWTSPMNPDARWKIIPVRDRSGAYSIESVGNPGQVLDIQGSQTADDTPVLTWRGNKGKNQQFFLRMA